MRSKYYKFPLEVGELFKPSISKPKLYTTLLQSLHQNLKLILTTSYGEFRYDHFFGTMVSEFDFTNEEQSGLFERSITESFYNAIAKWEPRLSKVNVSVRFDRRGELLNVEGNRTYRMYIIAKVEGLIHSLNEKYKHELKIFFSPLSE